MLPRVGGGQVVGRWGGGGGWTTNKSKYLYTPTTHLKFMYYHDYYY